MDATNRSRRMHSAGVSSCKRVGLVLGHPGPLFHLGFTQMLEDLPDVHLHEAAITADATMFAIEHHRPAVLVMALEFQPVLKRVRRPPRVLLLSPHAHLGAIDFGTNPCAFASETDSIEELCGRLRRITLCDEPRAGGALCAQCTLQPSLAAPKLPLSPRECEVFDLIASGLPTASIARRLGLSPKTVETYRANIKTKLGLSSGTALTEAALLWRRGMRLPSPAPTTAG